MMSVGEEDVQRWFDVVLQWGSADTSEKCRDTFECLDELQVFLKQLENALGGLVCINPAETQLALRSLTERISPTNPDQTMDNRNPCLDHVGPFIVKHLFYRKKHRCKETSLEQIHCASPLALCYIGVPLNCYF